MIILGIILLVLGFVFAIKILWYIGIALLVIGAVLAIMGHVGTGRTYYGGRRHFF